MRDLFLKNLPLKIFSVVLAALLWVVLETNQRTGTPFARNFFRNTTTREFEVPIAVMAPGNALRPLRLDPMTARVELAGDAHRLDTLRPEEIEVYVRLLPGWLPQGEFVLEVKVPQGLTVEAVQPSRVYMAPADSSPISTHRPSSHRSSSP